MNDNQIKINKSRIGEMNINGQGLKMKIIDYRRYRYIDVEFEDGYIAKNKTYDAFKNGLIRNPNYNNPMLKINSRINEESINKQGSKMKIIRYKNCRDIDIEFDNGYIVKNTSYKHFKNGSIRNPYFPDVFKIGYVGEGEYKFTINGINTREYIRWYSMMERCYGTKFQEKYPTYKDCTVCEEWCNFQNFSKWFNENYYEIDKEIMCLDKDILVKGNKIYSPETCIFVPNRINCLFIKNDNNRGNYLLGVTYIQKTNKFKATCYNNHLGYYNTEIEAFNVYKEFKEKLIKNIADEYKDKIPQKLYDAMYKWEVEITD